MWGPICKEFRLHKASEFRESSYNHGVLLGHVSPTRRAHDVYTGGRPPTLATKVA